MRYLILCFSLTLFAIHNSQAVKSIAPIIHTSTKSIVNLVIHGEIPSLLARNDDNKTRSKYPARKFKGYGSGVIVDTKKAYIITNAHIVQHAKKIFVKKINFMAHLFYFIIL